MNVHDGRIKTAIFQNLGQNSKTLIKRPIIMVFCYNHGISDGEKCTCPVCYGVLTGSPD